MYKKKIYVFIYLSIMLSVLLSAAPIDKYYLPPLQQYVPQQQAPSYKKSIDASSAYSDFERKVSHLSNAQKRELKDSLEKEKNNAVRNGNNDDKIYYQTLIDILDRHMETL